MDMRFFLTHTHLCLWPPARSCDMHTDYTFVHLALLSHFTFLKILQAHLYSHSEPQTSVIVFRAWLHVSSYLESSTARVNRDVYMSSDRRISIGFFFFFTIKSNTWFYVTFSSLFWYAIFMCTTCVWCPFTETIAVTFCCGLFTASHLERGGKRFSIWINYKCFEMSSIDKA